MNIRIVLNDLLVISCTKLWTVDGQNPAIEIGDTLKRKNGIAPLMMHPSRNAESMTYIPIHLGNPANLQLAPSRQPTHFPLFNQMTNEMTCPP